MIKVPRITLFFGFMLLISLAKSQETIIKVPFSQPKKLIADAGDNQVLYTGQTVTLGTDVSITGGSPEYSYNWKDDENNEYSTPAITVGKAGNYYLTVTDINHCTAIDSVNIALSTSVLNNEDAGKFSLFPNPSSGLFYFIVKSSEKNIGIEVASAEGRVVFKRKFEVSDHVLTGTIDLTGYDKGVYHVRLIMTDGSLIKSVVIQ
jgi:hypothetical protein